MSVATDKLRNLFNELSTGEEIDAEVKSKVALALDALVDVETEVKNNEDSKAIAVKELEEVKNENKRLREYNSQLTMKLGTAVAQVDDEKKEDEKEDKEVEEDFDKLVEEYKL